MKTIGYANELVYNSNTMNKTYSCTLTQKEIADLQTKISPDKINHRVPYTIFQAKLTGCTITAYTSGKVVFAGEDAFSFASPYLSAIQETSSAGSDEVGTGDYFGPVCVCACYLAEDKIDLVKKLQVNDSKQVSDDYILKVAPILMKELIYALQVLDNPTYNRVHQTHNMNQIKAKLHNQAYVHLKKRCTLPKLSVVDQFMPKEAYYKAVSQEPEIVFDLHFETKAESKYLAVACASIIARYTFLLAMEQISNYYKLPFPKGAGSKVDVFGYEFVQKYSLDELNRVAKVHFKNTEKIKEMF